LRVGSKGGLWRRGYQAEQEERLSRQKEQQEQREEVGVGRAVGRLTKEAC
jgi:hypothetical protein